MKRDYGAFTVFFHPNKRTASEIAKGWYDDRCLITGLERDAHRLDGAHLFPRSTHPVLANCSLNIWPLYREKHSWANESFDWVEYQLIPRDTISKMEWLIDNCLRENRRQVTDQLERLDKCRAYLGLTK